MKQRVFRTGALLLALMLAGTAAACAPAQVDVPDTPSFNEPAGIDLVENGTSQYSVVIPATPLSCEQYAASELNYFLQQATGVQLNVVRDDELPDAEGKYISLGATTLRETLLSDFDEDVLGYSGFSIATQGNTVLISGANDSRSYGTLYGVYDFLHYTIGLEIYAGDEFSCNEYGSGENVALYRLNYTSIPDIALMGVGSATLTQDMTYMRRMRLTGFFSNEYCMGTVHSTAGFFMNPSDYEEEHPEWFWRSAEQTGICWSSDGVADAIAQEIIDATEHSDARYVYVTQPDTEEYGCTCAACRENLQKYETASGLQLFFINRVAQKVKDYYDLADPGKDLTLAIFAYRFTLSAPSEQTIAAHPELDPKENVAVSFIPIGMDFETPITSAANVAFYQSMQRWSQIFHGRKLTVYTYGTGFHCFFDVFNDFGSISGSLEAYKALGVELINEQSNMESAMGCFEELRIYLKSKLAWDTDADVDALIEEFFAHYYKAAAPAMLEYFNAVTAYTSALLKENDLSMGIYVTMYDKIDYGTVNSLRSMLDRAEEEIAYLQNSDPQLYTALLDRIKKEKLSVYFTLLASFPSRLDSAQYESIKSEFTYYCARFNIVRWRENVSVDAFLEGLD